MPPLTIEETCSNHLPMTQQHPITPPKELLKQWEDDWFKEREHADVLLVNAYAAGALAGADAELEACCKWLSQEDSFLGTELRAERRRKPLSLREEALLKLKELQALLQFENVDSSCIRRALESIPDPS